MTTKDEYATITKYDLLYEQRMVRVECAVENINENLKELKNENKGIREELRSDFKWTIGLMITFLGLLITFSSILLGVMAKGFEWI